MNLSGRLFRWIDHFDVLNQDRSLAGVISRWRAELLIFIFIFFGTGFAGAAESTNNFTADTADAKAPGFTALSWSTKQGLPENTVTALQQTRDGYLWVGTTDGLARFDGVRFRLFSVPDGLPHSGITLLLEDRQGNLWVGTEQGLARRARHRHPDDPEFETILSGQAISGLAEDAKGRIWISIGRSLYIWNTGKLAKNVDRAVGLPSQTILLIYGDHEGTVWVWGTSSRLFQINNNKAAEVAVDFPLADSRVIHALMEDNAGRLWASPGNGYLIYREKGEWKQFSENQGVPFFYIANMAQTKDGTIWAGSYSKGIFYQQGNRFSSAGSDSVTTSGFIRTLYPDDEGNLWAGSSAGGLICLRPNRLTTLGASDGLRNEVVHAITELPEGELVAATEGGIYHWINGYFQRQMLSKADYYPWTQSVLAAPDGNLWWGTSAYLFNLATTLNPNFVDIDLSTNKSQNAVTVLHFDHQTNLWVGMAQGLWRMQAGKLEHLSQVPPGAGRIQALATTPDGVMYVGTEKMGLFQLQSNRTLPYTKQEGLKSDSVRALYFDSVGVLWIGTRGGGLSRLKDGKIVSYTSQQGLISDTISQILEDDAGALWLGSNRGISRVSKSELDDLAAGKITSLRPLNLGEDDGMQTEECSGGNNPAALKAQNGLFYFSTLKGIVVVNPKHFWQQNLPPTVTIETMFVNGQQVSFNSGLTTDIPAPSGLHEPEEIVLAPGQNNLEIHYTGLHSKTPASIVFRYQWGDADSGWTDVGTRRFANYNKLAPGHYRFHVQAANQDGDWPQSGATLLVYVQPYFYQTLGFQIMVVCLSAVGLALLVRHFVKRRILRRLQRLELENSLENERRRIARDLHDELGARLTGIAHLGELAVRNPQSSDEIKQQVGDITSRVQQLMSAMDEVVWTINPKNDSLPNIVNFLSDYAERFLTVTGIQWRLGGDFEFPPLTVSAQSRHNLLLAAKETLNNAVRHSGATLIQLDIHIEGNYLNVVITDNGHGFEISQARPGGNGLKNIRNRMELIKGNAEFHSEPGKGTIVTLSLPLPNLPKEN